MAAKRALERDIEIPPVKNRRRRGRCASDPERFCRVYFPDTFYNPFSRAQKYNISQLQERILYGGLKAIAAERGGGKSTITKIVGGIWGTLYGYIKYGVLLGATGRFAQDMLADIKDCFEFNDKLYEDFPEVCAPVRSLEGAAQRAKSQTAFGHRTRMIWSSDHIVLPTVEIDGIASAASGVIINTRGMDSSIRGLVRNNRRPDIVIVDDGETAESARSVTQTEIRLHALQKDVIGLAGPGKRMTAIYLGTIICKNCLTEQVTDRQAHPEWSGERQKRIIKWPPRGDLWQRYLKLKRDGDNNGDNTGKKARAFYRKHKKQMDGGAQVSNRHNYDKHGKDGSGVRLELSALQNAYNRIYTMGMDAFMAEYQNEPPEPKEHAAGIDETLIIEKIGSYRRGAKPENTEAVVMGVDVHDRWLYWAKIAAAKQMVTAIIDYGVEPVHSPDPGLVGKKEKTKQVEIAIFEALTKLAAEHKEINLGWVDAGYMTTAIYDFCKHYKSWQPSKGGSTRRGRYTPPKPGKHVRRIGSGQHQSYIDQDKVWLNIFDPDRFKQAVQAGFRVADPESAGSISLFDHKDGHQGFAEQICAESWDADKKEFVRLSRQNHWLDCMSQAIAAAHSLGLSVLSENKPAKTKRKLSELQAKRRGM